MHAFNTGAPHYNLLHYIRRTDAGAQMAYRSDPATGHNKLIPFPLSTTVEREPYGAHGAYAYVLLRLGENFRIDRSHSANLAYHIHPTYRRGVGPQSQQRSVELD